MANTLTIRDETGQVIGEPNVGSRAVLWRDRTGPLRSMQDTAIQLWIAGRCEEVMDAGGDVTAYLDQVVTVRDEGRY